MRWGGPYISRVLMQLVQEWLRLNLETMMVQVHRDEPLNRARKKVENLFKVVGHNKIQAWAH